ncbi:long-chain fatty acid--CoA ligase [Salimicrobium jeotgali]|uniref:Long-chain-fatty-acid--CoA ligase n=1 Tax=Salimicrobium jeotgali TaxID=1230341 RepID=K2GAI7_9BACI|nr:long-chain-fatty-acid--CoA ligase [Salimicrobium jeotgali]AKG05361.1 long-chain fatty acid--CoA ligase [Salimicrobium jeotgali]EKE31367.1 long-chain-fatty-acid--CoA ligase [Salimicrobium jeotgali]MBM7696977.1 fatty-acyl-CoA synthase [Salimicrobium jeotgali]
MNTEHFRFWPARLPKTLTIPETTLYDNLVLSAKKYPSKTAINYYGGTLTYRSLTDEVERLAGYLENELGVEPNDKLLLYMQNSPQFVISFFAILRLRATVVPANPMSTTEDLAFYVKDCDIRHVLTGEELYSKAAPLKESTSVDDIIVASYADYIDREKAPADIPDAVLGTGEPFTEGIPWEKVLANTKDPSPYNGTGADVAMIPYTSGTTGLPKGCVHTNDTVQANTYGASAWMSMVADTVTLTTLPLFHVTGLVHSALAPIASGSTMIMLTRWDRDYAAKAIEAYGCTHWINISTMLIDFLANPALENYDISSLEVIGGGGAPLPATVGEQLYERTGLRYVEGYGLSETISHTHFNPPDRPKMQCLGIPSFDVDARVIDVATGEKVAGYEEGELVVNGPQVFKGYHNREEENEQSHIELDGKTFFRTGDIVKMDEEGYFFLVDRLKRMINASGFKVWPTEVESILYKHPSIHQACVVSEPDEKRGETVKAFVILNDQAEGDIKEEDIIEWSKNHMAAYKYPRIVEFRDSFPMTSSGKILWRKLQENE